MERERITISIKKKVLRAIDRIIDGVDIRNRSHAIETLALKALDEHDTKNAVILIGGEDALRSLPEVKNNLKVLAKNNFEKIYIAVGYLAEEIKQKLGDGTEYNLEIEYLEEGEGSAGAILPLKKIYNETFLVINNQALEALDIQKALEFHKTIKGTATIITSDLENLNGLYIFEPDIFRYIPKGFSMLENDIFPKVNEEGKLVIRWMN